MVAYAAFAKKRAEVAPGVGADTDMFLIGPTLGSYTTAINAALRGKLADVYETILKKEKKEHDRAKLEMSSYVKKLQVPQRQTRQPPRKARTNLTPARESAIGRARPIFDECYQSILAGGYKSLLRRPIRKGSSE
jgi:hypothetical protein